jgi:hypothetical protein
VLRAPCLAADRGDVVNWAFIISTDLAILYFWGFKSLLYLALGSLFAGGIHPLAGHLLAEHYVFEKVGTRVAAGASGPHQQRQEPLIWVPSLNACLLLGDPFWLPAFPRYSTIENWGNCFKRQNAAYIAPQPPFTRGP